MSPLSPEAYAVIEGRHSDPFRYLGPHVEADGVVVRVFLPNADAVSVVTPRWRQFTDILPTAWAASQWSATPAGSMAAISDTG